MLRRYRELDGLAVLTDQDRGEYERALDGKAPPMWRIPNTVREVEPPQADLTAKRIFAAGRYTSQKGYDMLIPAFAPVAEAHPDWELKLCGRGVDTQKLRTSWSTSSGWATASSWPGRPRTSRARWPRRRSTCSAPATRASRSCWWRR